MAGPSAEDIIHAFARAVRESLEAGESIDVPDLGRFDVEHRQSQMVEADDGEATMAPPRDVITFTPENADT
ncbi:HU family DNA-binding protein [Longibacter sp.]|uniref:HU family DNA-binding protein n=1 Tax=Longibacter sp. TaxID=2045415 RepID=UPI003EBA4C04